MSPVRNDLDARGDRGDRDRDPPDPRVYLAAERTTLAWIRTGIALMGFGFVVARFGLFFQELDAAGVGHGNVGHRPGISIWVGTTLVLLGVWANVAAALRHFRFRCRFERGEPFVTPRGLAIVVLSSILAALGIAITLYMILVARK
jgi:putative membrane protein